MAKVEGQMLLEAFTVDHMEIVISNNLNNLN